MLSDAIRKHLELFKAAYCDGDVRPKHHYACHLPQMLDNFGMLVSCSAMERVHKVAKRYVAPRRNTTGYKLCTLEDVTLQQFHDRQADFLGVNCLVEGHELHALEFLLQLRGLLLVTLNLHNQVDDGGDFLFFSYCLTSI